MILQNNILLPFVVGDLWLILCYTHGLIVYVFTHMKYGITDVIIRNSGLFSLLIHSIFIFAETRRNSCPPWWSLVIFLNLLPNQQELYPWFFKTAVLQYFSKFPPVFGSQYVSKCIKFLFNCHIDYFLHLFAGPFVFSMFPKSTHETFSNKLYQTFKTHKRFVKPKLSRTDFTISHYAGEVCSVNLCSILVYCGSS